MKKSLITVWLLRNGTAENLPGREKLFQGKREKSLYISAEMYRDFLHAAIHTRQFTRGNSYGCMFSRASRRLVQSALTIGARSLRLFHRTAIVRIREA